MLRAKVRGDEIDPAEAAARPVITDFNKEDDMKISPETRAAFNALPREKQEDIYGQMMRAKVLGGGAVRRWPKPHGNALKAPTPTPNEAAMVLRSKMGSDVLGIEEILARSGMRRSDVDIGLGVLMALGELGMGKKNGWPTYYLLNPEE